MNPSSSKRTPIHSLRDKLREVKTEAILAAAEEVFAAKGLQAGMDAIAARAGMAVGTLYNHFQDKQALLQALVASRRAALLARVDAALQAGREAQFADGLRLFFEAVLAHVADHGRFLSVLLQLEHTPDMACLQRGARSQLEQRAAELVRRGLAARALRADGKDLYADLIIALAKSALVRETAAGPGKRRLSPARSAALLARLFLDGAGA